MRKKRICMFHFVQQDVKDEITNQNKTTDILT